VSNLAPDPGFEIDPTIDYYTHGTGVYVWALDAPHTGNRSLKIVSSQPEGSLARWLSKNDRIKATAGNEYIASVWMKGSNIKQYGLLAMNFLDANLNYLGTTYESLNP